MVKLLVFTGSADVPSAPDSAPTITSANRQAIAWSVGRVMVGGAGPRASVSTPYIKRNRRPGSAGILPAMNAQRSHPVATALGSDKTHRLTPTLLTRNRLKAGLKIHLLNERSFSYNSGYSYLYRKGLINIHVTDRKSGCFRRGYDGRDHCGAPGECGHSHLSFGHRAAGIDPGRRGEGAKA